MENKSTKSVTGNSVPAGEGLFSLLKEGRDYGILSGNSRPILYRSGAEKLLTCLRLKIDSLSCVCSVTDIGKNFIDYTYRCSVKNSKGDIAGISEGSSNSFEECYRKNYEVKDVNLLTREQYREKLKNGDGKWIRRNSRWLWTEKIPKGSVIAMKNFIQKTAQRRAFVGAVLMASGLSESFRHD